MASEADQGPYYEYGAADPSSAYSTAGAPTGAYSQADSTSQDALDAEQAENRGSKRCACMVVFSLVFVFGIVFSVVAFKLFSPTDEDETHEPKPQPNFFGSFGGGRISTTSPKPTASNYKRVALEGLICHSTYEKVLATPPTDSCDFVMVDVKTLEPYLADPGSYAATVPFDPADIEPLFEHLQNGGIQNVILSHDGNLLFQTDQAPLPKILRGLRQNIVDKNAHGLALGWPVLTEPDLHTFLPDIRLLSDELVEYHGLVFCDEYTGDLKTLNNFMVQVGRMESMTFVYQISNRTSIFTHPYYDNFYLHRISENPLVNVIEEQVIKPIKEIGVKVNVALSMSLMSVSCPANTLYKGMKPTPCVRIPVGASQICKIYPAYIQGEYYSVMTRRYTGGAVDSLTEDVFFETQHTVSKKAYLMLNQLKKAQVGPMAFVLRDYYLDLDAPATYTDHTGKPVPCTAQPFGIIKSTRAEIGKLI